ncbi:MAG: hypothetical protein HY965_06385 [Ignavibacteriales bacterium]|nr:hypothetical protein [Ignavibacteriales bacterium]
MKHQLLLICLLFSGCSVLTPVRVLSEKSSAVSLSFGGPYVPSASPTGVIPYTTIGYAYGYKENVTLSGNFHVLSAIFKTPGVDAGIVYRALRQNGNYPEITVYPKLYFFHDFSESKNFRCFPDIACNLSYCISEKYLAYGGLDYIMQLTRPEHFLTPFIGFAFPCFTSVSGQVEIKWMASNADTRHGVFEGESSVSGKGTIGLFTGVSYAF